MIESKKKGKFSQMKAWPTRRNHLFLLTENESLCGLVTVGQSFPMVSGIDLMEIDNYHEYDNLNYCQSCLRVAMAERKIKYKPLKKFYEEKYGLKG